jgi:enoyl-CoA hydratase/carnithine racemase
VVAAKTATFGVPEVKRGIMPFMVMAILQRELGHKRALEMILTGAPIDATRAEALGLCNQVFDGEFLPQAIAYAEKIAAYSPATLRLGKRAFYTQADMTFAEALPYLHAQLTVSTLTEDALEGISAFLQKREPVWSGK